MHHREFELQLQPGREEGRRGGVGGAVHFGGQDRLERRLVEDRGQLGAPEGEPRPGEVGVSR